MLIVLNLEEIPIAGALQQLGLPDSLGIADHKTILAKTLMTNPYRPPSPAIGRIVAVQLFSDQTETAGTILRQML